METFDDYLATITNEEHQKITRDVLNWVRENYPDMTERIAWSSPTFVAHGTHIISFKHTKKHLAVSIEGKAVRHFAETFDKNDLNYGTMNVNFPWKTPINLSLLKDIIDYNLEDKKDLTSYWRK